MAAEGVGRHHRDSGDQHHHEPAHGLAGADELQQQQEADHGVERLRQGLDGHVDDGRGRGLTARRSGEHRQGAGAHRLADGRDEAYQVGDPVADPARHQAGIEAGPGRHRPPGHGAHGQGGELQRADLEHAGPADVRQGAADGGEPGVGGQDRRQGQAGQEGQRHGEALDHARAPMPKTSPKRTRRTALQASATSGSTRAASSSVTR